MKLYMVHMFWDKCVMMSSTCLGFCTSRLIIMYIRLMKTHLVIV